MAASTPKIRLYVPPEEIAPLCSGDSLLREGDAAHYLQRVMRLKQGAQIALFNGRDGAYCASIAELGKKTVLLTVHEQLSPPQPTPDAWVCFAPIKFGRIDYLVQKMTELGAGKLLPTITDYTQSERVKLDRLRANAIEAAEQTGRCDVPDIEPATALRHLLADWPEDRLLLFADESGHGQTAAQALAKPESKWGILIGPEGGFSQAERELLYELPFVRGISLGPRILRADTAAISLLTLTMHAWGDWHAPPKFNAGERAS